MKNICLLLFFLITVSFNSFAQDPYFKASAQVKLKLGQLRELCYNFDVADDEDTRRKKVLSKQLFANPYEAFIFLQKIENTAAINSQLLSVGLNSFTEYTSKNKKALIFLSHPVDLEKLVQLKSLDPRRTKLKTFYDENITTIATYQASVTNLENISQKYLDTQKDNAVTPNNPNTPGAATSTHKLTLEEQGKYAIFYNSVQAQLTTLKQKIKDLEEENIKYRKEFYTLFDEYAEDKAITKFLLHQIKNGGPATLLIVIIYLT